MTAINIVRQSDRVTLISDGAFYTHEGVLVGIGQKVVPIPRLKMVVGIQGTNVELMLLTNTIDSLFSSYDEMKRHIAPVACRVHASLRSRLAPSAYGEAARIFVAGWSESGGPDAFTMRTRDEDREPAWKLLPITISLTPSDGVIQNALWDHLAGRTEIDAIDARELGVAMMEVQRGRRMRFNEYELFGVGAHIDVTTITSAGITTERVKAWPDVIGQKINPHAKELAS